MQASVVHTPSSATPAGSCPNVPPTRISVLLLKTPRADLTWSIVSGFKRLENDVVILAALTDIETDWHRGVAYVGMSRVRTRLHILC